MRPNRLVIAAFSVLSVFVAVSRLSGPAVEPGGPPAGAPAGPPPGAPAAVSSDWQSAVMKQIVEREYEVTWQTPTRIEGVEAAWQAPNRAHNLRSYFTNHGIHVIRRTGPAPSWQWGLEWVGYGRGGRSWRVPPATSEAKAARLDYRRGALEEWYENSPRGLEQGFVLRASPEEVGARPNPEEAGRGTVPPGRDRGLEANRLIHVDLALKGDLYPVVSEDGLAIDFETQGGARVIHYAGLKVTDARGATLKAWMEGFTASTANGIRIVIDGEGAVYPIVIDPMATSPAWSAEGDQENAEFATSIASAGDVNGDGFADVIVGAPGYDNGQHDEGRVYVYLGSPSGLGVSPGWTAEGDQDNALFGLTVSAAGDVNADGYSDIIVGSYNYFNARNHGRAYAYLGSATGPSPSPVWTMQVDQEDACFACAVSAAGDVNGDGYSDVLIGANSYDNDQPAEGRAYVYAGSASGLSSSPAWTAEGDQSGAAFGGSVAAAGDVNGDGYADVIVGSRYYDNGHLSEGRACLYLGSASGLSSSPAWIVEGNQDGADFGSQVASPGDVNGDGYSDVIVGACDQCWTPNMNWKSYVFFGSASGLSLTAATYLPEGGVSGTPGDVNADGFADIILGVPGYDNGQGAVGRVYVYLGSASGPSVTSRWTLQGDQAGASWGMATMAGDVDGDGFDDVLVAAPDYVNGQARVGRAYLYLGTTSGLLPDPSWTAESDQAYAYFGCSVGTAGDVNGDGFADVIVGAYGYDNGQVDAGRAYVFLGSAQGLSLTPAWAEGGRGAVRAYFGYSVATAGDVNGDGYADIVVGAPSETKNYFDEGRAYVYLGSSAGLSQTPAWTAQGNEDSANFGVSVGTGGDVNGDGYDDVIVGADLGLFSDWGRAFVYSGSPSGPAPDPAWTAEGSQANEQFGISVGTAGDVNGDGYADVIVGGWGYSGVEVHEGRAYVFPGSASGLSPAPAWTTEGTGYYERLGWSVAAAGDVNGDGYGDVIVGGRGADESGIACVFLGSPAGVSPAPHWTAEGGAQWAGLGYAVGTAGDVNADGFDDVIVGSGEYDEGRAYVYLGSASGLPPATDWAEQSEPAHIFFGASVKTAGDVNGDGYADVIVGAPKYGQASGGGQYQEGRAFLFYGYSSTSGCSDLDGDGFGTSGASAMCLRGPAVDCDDARAGVFPGAPQACDGLNNDCVHPTWPSLTGTNEGDDDSDTFTECSGDCDDAHDTVFPGAPQVCDGLDSDCNNPSWPIVPANEADADSDGYRICSGDCDDAHATTYPGAPQICDGLDNDCNDPSWPAVPANEADADGDACLLCAGDCNEADALVHPGATETCNGYDDDCDSVKDEGCAGLCGLPRKAAIDADLTPLAASAGAPALTWTGSGYGAAWSDSRDGNLEIHFARFDSSLNPIGGEVRVTSDAGSSQEPVLAWTGAGYGIAWSDNRDGNEEIYFARLDGAGIKVGPDVRVTNAAGASLSPRMAWSGIDYGLLWLDQRDGVFAGYFARVDAAGAVVPGSERRLTALPYSVVGGSLAWSGALYGIAYNVFRDADWELYFQALDRTGTTVTPETRMTTSIGISWASAIAWDGAGGQFGISWVDDRSGADELFFTRVAPGGAKLTGDNRLVAITAPSGAIDSLAHSGGEFAVAWQDTRAGDTDVYFARLANDAFNGPELRVTEDPAASTASVMLWNGSEYAFAFLDTRLGPSHAFAARIACCDDADGDGYRVCLGDCDDTHASVYPAAPQICDGINNDCSDPGWPTAAAHEADSDGDGYRICGGDCGDRSASVHPGAAESCDGIDNNCDGGLDEGCDLACDNPEKAGSDTRITFEPGNSAYPALAWNGSGFGVAWTDTRTSPYAEEIYFARLDAAGNKLGFDRAVTSADGLLSRVPSLAWNGSEYGVAWEDSRNGGGTEIYFARLDAAGNKIGPDVRLTAAAGASRMPALVWSGTEYAIAWQDDRGDSTNTEIFFARLDVAGNRIGPEVRVTTAAGLSSVPAIVRAGSGYGIAWQDDRGDPNNYEIYVARLDAAGSLLGPDIRVTDSPGASWVPSLVWTGSAYGVAWSDNRGDPGNYEIYFTLLDATGVRIGTDVRVTNSAGTSFYPSVAWNGSEYGVVWEDERNAGNYEVYFSRLDGAGNAIGPEVRMTSAAGGSRLPSLAWTGSDYGVAWYDYRDSTGNVTPEIYFAKVACCDDADGDAFNECHDCNDSNPGAYPGAPQVCDGVNNDCSDPSWPAVPAAEQDADGDGYRHCSGECNNADPFIHPGAAELCNGLDDDCDGVSDEGCDATCDLPAKVAPETDLAPDGAASGRSPLIWTGSSYAAAWSDTRDGNAEIYFARYDAALNRIGNEVRVTNDPAASQAPSLTWTGMGFGVAWGDDRDGNLEIYFALLDSMGNKASGDMRVTNAAGISRFPRVVWTGTDYGLAWIDQRDGGFQAYFARVDAAGEVVGGSERRITTPPYSVSGVQVSWNGSDYGITYSITIGPESDIYFQVLDRYGATATPETQLTVATGMSRAPSIAWDSVGKQFGISWMDNRSGADELFFMRVAADGTKLTGDSRLVAITAPAATNNALTHSGGEFAIAWQDTRGGNTDIYFARLAGDMFNGPEVRVTDDAASSSMPTIEWNGYEYLVGFLDNRTGPLHVGAARLGCCTASTIGDRAWDDTDRDGIQDAGEPGVSGVVVEVYDASGVLLSFIPTAVGGGYMLSGLTCGSTYTLRFLPPPGMYFSPAHQGGDDALDSDADSGTGSTAPFVLTSSADAGLWDVGLHNCWMPYEPVFIINVRLSGDGNHHPILDFDDLNQAEQVTGYNVRRSSVASLPAGEWPLVATDVLDMDEARPNKQWMDQSGDMSPTGAWYYQVTAYNNRCPAEGPF